MSDPFRPAAGETLLRTAIAMAGCALAASAAASGANATEVTVYTLRSMAVTAPASAILVHLDGAEAIEAQLSANLTADPASAVSVARQRLEAGEAKLQHDLAAAYEDIAVAWSLGITTLPAVVVDRRYVVYGEPDVASAVAKIEAFRRTQP